MRRTLCAAILILTAVAGCAAPVKKELTGKLTGSETLTPTGKAKATQVGAEASLKLTF